MQYLEITIRTAPAGIDPVAAALTAGGFPDLLIEDQAEFESFLEENRQCWDYIDEELQQQLQGLSQIKLYLEKEDTAALARLEALVQSLRKKDLQQKLGALTLTVTELAETNWEESWKENYPPQSVGERLIVLPYWLADTASGGRLPIILDPGLTFGTGAHPSTQMVMQTMEELPAPRHCLDLGSGSGILSITALRLGAESAIGIDIDPKAEDIARENAAYNGFGSPEFTALTGNVTQDLDLMARLAAGSYDLVLVNIVADVIIGLAPVLPNLVKSGSTLICSGILNTRLQDVTAALQQAGLEILKTRTKENWCCVMAKRREV